MAAENTTDPLIKKSRVAKEYRGVTTRQLYTLIKAKKWPPPDVPAKERGQADYYFRSTAERAKAAFLRGEYGLDAERTNNASAA